jgi:NAD(P)-dependent dehydrogenase (short-subunit alcohol dehydrogenase family)
MELEGRVVVVTGSASGIGLALATEFAEAGARVVLTDVEATALDASVSALEAAGLDVRGVQVDVRRRGDVEALAARVELEFGGTDVLCNNAGVIAAPALMWEAPREDQEWVFGVNFWGIMNGVQAFVPRMIARGTPAYVVNTSSMTAIVPMGGASSYIMSKTAILALTETLAKDLEMADAPVRVGVVLPEHFKTRLGTAHRNRAEVDDTSGRVWGPIWDEADDPMLATGADPRGLSRRVLAAIRDDEFWILPSGEDAMSVEAISRMRTIEGAFG